MATTAYAQAAALLPDDVLAAVLALAKRLSGKSRLVFKGHDFELQKVFRKLVREHRSPLLDQFVFSDRGPDPYSPILSESISRLQLSGLVGRENPDYEMVFLRHAGEQYFDRELKARFTKPQMKELRRVAGRFLELVDK